MYLTYSKNRLIFTFSVQIMGKNICQYRQTESHNINFCIKERENFNFGENFIYEEIVSWNKTKIPKTYDIIKMY